MITLAREKSVEIPFRGAKITARYKVPTALEAEEIITSKLKDSDVFKRFAIDFSGSGCEDIDGSFPSELLEIPGTYPIMNKVALEIINSAIISEEEKN